jgi:hypothetical protein
LRRYGHVDRRVPAVELETRLVLHGQNAVRRLVVPYEISFHDLHRVLQSAFEWTGYNLYTFEFYLDRSKKKSSGAPDVQIAVSDLIRGIFDEEGVLDGDEFDARGHDIFDLLDEGRKIALRAEMNHLCHLIQRFSRFVCLSDGYRTLDDWKQVITIKKIHRNYKGWLPFLLSGSGDSPPEECGGPQGYKRLLAILAERGSEGREEMIQSGELWPPFNLDICRIYVQGVVTPCWKPMTAAIIPR